MKSWKIMARSLRVGLALISTLFFSNQTHLFAEKGTVEVDFYYSKTCPHCAKQKPLMTYIDQHNEQVEVNAIVAIAGLINIKDYFFFKISFTTTCYALVP